MLVNCDVTVIFPIYGQFGAIQKLDSRCILKVSFYLTKTENRTKKLSNSSHAISLSKGTTFDKKCCFFAKEMLTSAKVRGS